MDARYQENFESVMSCSNDIETLEFYLSCPGHVLPGHVCPGHVCPGHVLPEDAIIEGNQPDFFYAVDHLIPELMTPLVSNFAGTIMCTPRETLQSINARPRKLVSNAEVQGDGDEEREYRRVIVPAGTLAYVYVDEECTGDTYLFVAGNLQEMD